MLVPDSQCTEGSIGDADAMSEMHDAASPDECDEFTAFHAKGPMDQTTAV